MFGAVVEVAEVAEVADAEPMSAVANVVGSKKADYKSGFDGQIFVNYSDLQQRPPRSTATATLNIYVRAHLFHHCQKYCV